MKVYTEVNYIWKDDKLVQTDSKSFDYEGEVSLCHNRTRRVGSKWTGYKTINIPHTHKSINDIKPKGGTTAEATNAANEAVHSGATAITTGIKKIKETVSKGPTGGTAKDVADALYGGSTKDLVEKAQETYVNLETSFNKNKDDLAQALFAPTKNTLEETATSLINKNKPISNVNRQEEDQLLYGSRRGIQMQDEGQRATSGGLRRDIHELRTLSGKAKPKG